MKVEIVGATGQLGSDAIQAFAANGDTVHALGHGDTEGCLIDSVGRRQFVCGTET